MPKITYVQPNGDRSTLEVSAGTSVMHAAIVNGVPGIVAECGGSAMCATCHVYVDPEYLASIPEIAEVEIEMLGSAASEQRDNSRLSCQLVMGAGIDEIVVHLPQSQV